MSNEEPKPVEVIFLGRCEVDGKLAMRLLPVALYSECADADAAMLAASVFTVKERDMPRAVGTAYVVDGYLEGKRLTKIRGEVRFDAGIAKRSIVNGEWQAIWEARSEAVKVAARARKLHTEIAKDTNLPKMLAGLKQRYDATDRIGKLALEVVVLDALRR